MQALLESIGYNSWVLPALLIIPVIGALLVLNNGDGTFGMAAAGSIKIEPMTAPAGSS